MDLLLPIILFAILRLVNDRELMGTHVNGPLYNIAAWLTAIVVTILSLLFILITLFPSLSAFLNLCVALCRFFLVAPIGDKRMCLKVPRELVLVSLTRSLSSCLRRP